MELGWNEQLQQFHEEMMLEMIRIKGVLGGCRGGDQGPQEDVSHMSER